MRSYFTVGHLPRLRVMGRVAHVVVSRQLLSSLNFPRSEDRNNHQGDLVRLMNHTIGRE